jgi:hypothetical protein
MPLLVTKTVQKTATYLYPYPPKHLLYYPIGPATLAQFQEKSSGKYYKTYVGIVQAKKLKRG